MEISDVIGYLFFFGFSLIMIFKPAWFRDFFMFIIRIFRGWDIKKDHPFQKLYLILIRIVGIIYLIVAINGLLIDTGLTKKEVKKVKWSGLSRPIFFKIKIQSRMGESQELVCRDHCVFPTEFYN